MKLGSRQNGFTLVEVVMALAIAATAIVILLALLPGAADSIGDNHRTGRALYACIRLTLADVREVSVEGEMITDLMGIVFPMPGEEVERIVYFDADGVLAADERDALFRVTLILGRSEIAPEVMNIDCEARWPASVGTPRAGSVNVWGIREL